MRYNPEPDSHIRDKFKDVLDLSNYATKKIEHATSAYTSYLAVKSYFIVLKVEVDKLDINTLVKGPTSLNIVYRNIWLGN